MKEVIALVIKIISNYYYVLPVENEPIPKNNSQPHISKIISNIQLDNSYIADMVIECKAKGGFRRQGITPYVGDVVKVSIDDNNKVGNIDFIYKRQSQFSRPTVANVQQVGIVFALSNPKINYDILNKYIITMEEKAIDYFICFNKLDIEDKKESSHIKKTYKYFIENKKLIFTSSKNKALMTEFKKTMLNKLTMLTGPSGVGKSSLISALADSYLEIGSLSEKNLRGKQTTRHYELLTVNQGDTYGLIIDTPGFTALELSCDAEELKYYYPEFTNYRECKFGSNCNHIHEPDCSVKEAVLVGDIAEDRYESYVSIYNQLQNNKSYKNKRNSRNRSIK